MEYKVIRSKRKTLSLEVKPEGVIVRAPFFVPKWQIDRFVKEREPWIRNSQNKLEQKKRALQQVEPLSEEDIKKLAKQAKKVIPERVKYYAPIVGVSYGRITIRSQKSRWGSCSAKGNLNFNCLLMLTPDEVIDSVVVHELCHRLQMNHSAKFYREVYRVYPEYDLWNKWLKKNGPILMARMAKGKLDSLGG
ncbi:MAG: M48 family metallopeptidase [Oscillospiraceae bacterium]|nr:M48 family metallopeptidase [Oscillospiraceae bacterium]